jgi:drug/metabolite transporter (DMT)-like permease
MVHSHGREVDLHDGPIITHDRGMNLGLVLALVSAGAYGAADFVGGAGSRRHSSWQIVLVGQLVGAIVMTVTGALVGGHPGAADYGWAVLAGAGSATGSIFLFRGLSLGHMSLVAPISAVGAAALPVIVGVALGDRPTWLTWVGVTVALPGIWLVSREHGIVRAPGSRGAVVDGAVAGAGFGVLFIALAQISSDAGLLPLGVNQLAGTLLTIAAASTLRQQWRPRRRVLGWGAASGALGAGGTLAFTVATGMTDLGVTSVLASLYPAVTVLLALAVLGERLATDQRVGIGICVASIAALAG